MLTNSSWNIVNQITHEAIFFGCVTVINDPAYFRSLLFYECVVYEVINGALLYDT